MKLFNKIIDISLYVLAAIMMITAISSLVWEKPVLFSVIRSDSMYPKLAKGDLLLIKNLKEDEMISIGNIVIFKAQEGYLSSKGYVVHRIIGGDNVNGFITKGDANEYSDQETGSVLIKRDWIVSKTIGNDKNPTNIPFIGYPAIWMENMRSNRYTLPLIVLMLAVIIGINEFVGRRKKNKRNLENSNKNIYESRLLYLISGFTVSIIVAASMITISHRISFPYEISDNKKGIIMGSQVEILNTGDERQVPLAKLNNNGFLPITAVITSNDPQLSFNHTLVSLKNGEELSALVFLKAQTQGDYNSVINIGFFYPFLPSKLIYFLAVKNYWLALVSVSLIPGLPLMVYPLLDKNTRRQTSRFIRKNLRRIRYKLQFT